MPTSTANLSLTKPLGTEQYDVNVFNGNADLIDAKFAATGAHAHSGAAGDGPKLSVSALASGTAGQLITWAASGAAAAVATGTAGNVLTSNGAGAAPTFQAGSGKLKQFGFASGASGGPTTASTTYVDLTDMSVALTTTGGDLLCFFDAPYGQTSAAIIEVYFAFQLDAATEVADTRLFASSATSHMYHAGLMWRFTGVASAAHTVKVRWKVGSGTGQSSGTSERRLLVMEVTA